MVIIIENTYPNMETYPEGTICIWTKSSTGHVELYPCDKTLKKPDYQRKCIMSLGQIYTIKGDLLKNKKEPNLIGIVAQFKKEGWLLNVKNYKTNT